MKYTSACPNNGLTKAPSSDLLFWAQLFLPESVELDPNKLIDGTFLGEVFQQIDGRTPVGNELCQSPETVKARLGNWHYVLRNLRNYYLNRRLLHKNISVKRKTPYCYLKFLFFTFPLTGVHSSTAPEVRRVESIASSSVHLARRRLCTHHVG
ncbi:unnamed protein product [Echinostoma caproni]|uniref:Calponin-homology (CH) domain-containing protein n=1 Tax=Echinostoma caproni TaxID=27848 RepID=A0A183APQ6_9TREM|nr:unnamed protein product [Echinostoma caproni]